MEDDWIIVVEMEMSFDLSKLKPDENGHVFAQSDLTGEKVRILCIDGPNYTFPIIGLFNGNLCKWTLKGISQGAYEDIINIPIVRRGYINIYKDALGECKAGNLIFETMIRALEHGRTFPMDCPVGSKYVTTIELPEWRES